jgi:glycosyltransferase involved in cell wall biosynthesis
MNQESTSPIFSIIIPTKNRAEYLSHTLRTCSIQEYQNIEVFVCDDGSTDNTREVVEEASRKDPRIKYVSFGNEVGMRDNFENALNLVKDGYVLALGGDDALLPYGISSMYAILKDTQQEILCWPAPAFFYPKTKMENGQLILHAKKGKIQNGIKILSSKDFLIRQSERLSYVSDIESPMFYVKGVVSTRLIHKVKGRSPEGRFYTCSTPDGYSGIVLAGEVDTYAFSHVPFSMHGVSPTSAGVGYLSNDDKAKIQSAAFFKKAESIPMHKELASQPYSPLITVMTADYLLTARDLNGWKGKFPKINFKQLLDQSLLELCDGLFAYDRISRELEILKNIAQYHNLEGYFNDKVKLLRRNKRKTLEGNAISKSRVYINASDYNINNVFDAAYVSFYMYQFVPKTKLSTIIKMIINSVQYGIMGLKKGENLPQNND